MGRAPSALSMVNDTSARPRGGRPAVPAKMTSSILPPRRDLAPCSPITHASASTTLDLPDPFGPTMQVMPGSSWSVVAEAKDLNPLRVRLFRYKVFLFSWIDVHVPARAGAKTGIQSRTPAGGSGTSRLRARAGQREPAPAC